MSSGFVSAYLLLPSRFICNFFLERYVICTFAFLLLTVARTKFMFLKAVRGFILGTENRGLNEQELIEAKVSSQKGKMVFVLTSF